MPDADGHGGGGRDEYDAGHRPAPSSTGPTGPSSRLCSATGASPTGPSPRRSGSPRRPCAAGSSACAKSGIMQIVAVTDPLQLGFTRQAMVGISVEGDVRRVADKLIAMPEVDYVVMCAGSFDILAEIVCEDDERLLHVLNDSVRSIPGVRPPRRSCT